MKQILSILVLLAVLVSPAFATRSDDLYNAARVVQVAAPANTQIGTGLVTNTVDLIAYDGTVNINLFACTNTGVNTGTFTATLYGSYDQTNYTALQYSLGSNLAVTYTNRYYGSSSLTLADTYILPGTWTTPSVASAGFATPYLAPTPMTNTAAITLAPKGNYVVGINAGDAPRYLHIVWSVGTATNFTYGATLTGFTHSGQLSQ